MLDEKDLQQIKDLMDAQKSEILQQTQELMRAQKDEILQQTQELMRAQKDEVLHQAAQNTQVIIEKTIGKQLQLLLEGQKLMMETLAPHSRVDALESEMDLAKSVLRSHSERIDALEKKFA